jgi:hypothetical protein
MRDALNASFEAARGWLEHAQTEGWIADDPLEQLSAVERASPADLFESDGPRPLVVAFFGGTGVGKSSLLNRLVGQPIAATGVERPTSYEVTRYVHEAVDLARLPDHFPGDRVRTERHSDDRRRGVMWIDMPDIDSTEPANRALALAWLAHIDLVIYVVSPERYRDDVGWRVLRARGRRHGWMFVMNHWDEGDVRQPDDLRRLLAESGFDDPLVMRTCCAAAQRPLPSPDEFDGIEREIRALLDAHGQEELERLGIRARIRDIRSILRDAREQVGSDEQWQAIGARWRESWRAAVAAIRAGTEFPIRVIAGQFAVDAGSPWSRLIRATADEIASRRGARGGAPERSSSEPARETAHDPGELERVVRSLWGAWSDDRLREFRDEMEVAMRRVGVRPDAAVVGMDTVLDRAADHVRGSTASELRASLGQPGGAWRRRLRGALGWISIALPLAALLVVGVNVVVGYYRATMGRADFLGPGFAVNSILLVAIAWAIPAGLSRLLRPSIERIAERAMRVGLDQGLEALTRQVEAAWSDVSAGRSRLIDALARVDEKMMAGHEEIAVGASAARLVGSA